MTIALAVKTAMIISMVRMRLWRKTQNIPPDSYLRTAAWEEVYMPYIECVDRYPLIKRVNHNVPY